MSAVILPWQTKKRDAALAYAAIGWHVLPVWWIENGQCACGTPDCKNAGKHPINTLVRHGKDEASADADTIRAWWNEQPNANVAVDAEKSGLVVVDVDPRNGGLATKDILEDAHGAFSSEVMAFSGGGGEHWVYKRPSAVSSLPGKLGPGVDLKLNGYFIVEPSNHKSGGAYEWEASSSPLDGEIPSPLPDWIRSLSVVTKATHQAAVEQGCRFAGSDTIDDLRSALAAHDADDRDAWVNNGLALCSLGQVGFDLWDAWSQTSDKYDPVDTLRVWRSFKPGSRDYESIFFEAQQAGWINPQSIGGAPEQPVELPSPVAQNETPEEFLSPPFRRLAQTVDWLDSYSIKTKRLISVVGAMAIAQGATARVFRSLQHHNHTTWYQAIIAPTGSGKDYIRQAYADVFRAAGHPDMIGKAGFSSGAGLRDTLHENPKSVSFLDEFGDMINHGVNDKGGPKRDLFATLRKAFNAGQLEDIGFSKGANRSGDSVVVDPCLGIVGLTTQAQFVDTISEAMMADGTLNRFVIVQVEEAPRRNSLPTKTVPDWLARHVADLRKAAGPLGNLATTGAHNPEGAAWFHIPFTNDALAYLDEIGDHEAEGSQIAEFASQSHVHAEACSRWREIAMRMSVCLSAYEQDTDVSRDTLAWCYRWVSHFGQAFVRLYEAEANQGELEKLRGKFLEKIRSYGKEGCTRTQLSRDRPFRGVPRVLREQLFADMVEGGEIVMVKHKVEGSDREVTRCLAVD